MVPALRRDHRLLNLGEKLLAIHQGPSKLLELAQTTWAVDLLDVVAAARTSDPGFHQPQNPLHPQPLGGLVLRTHSGVSNDGHDPIQAEGLAGGFAAGEPPFPRLSSGSGFFQALRLASTARLVLYVSLCEHRSWPDSRPNAHPIGTSMLLSGVGSGYMVMPSSA